MASKQFYYTHTFMSQEFRQSAEGKTGLRPMQAGASLQRLGWPRTVAQAGLGLQACTPPGSSCCLRRGWVSKSVTPLLHQSDRALVLVALIPWFS